MDATKHDALNSTNVGPDRQVLLAVSRGDDIVLASKGADAAAAPPAGRPVSGLVARPGQAGHVIASIAEERRAGVTVTGSSRRPDLATMFLGQRS